MDTLIDDIRNHIKNGSYKNEEEVKVGIILRVLQSFGWNIWDPGEVSLEYKVSDEDNTKVDFALFYSRISPAVYIEAKSMNRADSASLSEIERQLRNYNRDNTAPITIISDGKTWYFYLSQTGGVFSRKRFKDINWLKDTNEEIKETFALFLKKEELEFGSAVRKANELLSQSNVEKAISDYLHIARNHSNNPPFPSLVDTMIQIIKKELGITITRENAIEGIKKAKDLSDTVIVQNPVNNVMTPPRLEQPRNNDIHFHAINHTQRDLRWSEIVECRFDGKNLNRVSWNNLLRIVFTKAFSIGWTIDQVHNVTGINIYDHNPNTRGYNPIGYKNYYSLDVESTKAGKNIELLCGQLNFELFIKYRHNQGNLNGQIGIIENRRR